MPYYVGRPFTVEAHQFNGIVSDLPPSFIPAVEQGHDGTATVDTLGGFMAMQRGDFLVHGVEGFAVMHAATFEVNFAPVVEQVSISDGTPMVTYIGDRENPDATPPRLSWMGVDFKLHEAVPVRDPDALAKLRDNRHFVVVGGDVATAVETQETDAVNEVASERRGPGRPRKAA